MMIRNRHKRLYATHFRKPCPTMDAIAKTPPRRGSTSSPSKQANRLRLLKEIDINESVDSSQLSSVGLEEEKEIGHQPLGAGSSEQIETTTTVKSQCCSQAGPMPYGQHTPPPRASENKENLPSCIDGHDAAQESFASFPSLQESQSGFLNEELALHDTPDVPRVTFHDTPDVPRVHDTPDAPRDGLDILIDRLTKGKLNDILSKEAQEEVQKFIQGSKDLATLRLRIDDYEVSTFRAIVRSLFHNKSLRKLIVCRGWAEQWSTRTAAELKWFLKAVRSLELERLVIINYDEKDLDGLAVVLQQHPTLTSFQLRLAYGTVDEAFLSVLNSISTLETVELETNHSFPVGWLLKSESLQSLQVTSENFEFEDEHLVSLARELATNKTLVSLDIEPLMSPFSFFSLASVLRKNKTLEELYVSVIDEDNGGDEAATKIAEALERNSTLKTLWNHSHKELKVSRHSERLILDRLEKNSSLRKFHFFYEDLPFNIQKKGVLRRNRISRNGFDFFAKTCFWTQSCGVLLPIGDCVGGENEFGKLNIGVQTRQALLKFRHNLIYR